MAPRKSVSRSRLFGLGANICNSCGLGDCPQSFGAYGVTSGGFSTLADGMDDLKQHSQALILAWSLAKFVVSSVKFGLTLRRLPRLQSALLMGMGES